MDIKNIQSLEMKRILTGKLDSIKFVSVPKLNDFLQKKQKFIFLLVIVMAKFRIMPYSTNMTGSSLFMKIASHINIELLLVSFNRFILCFALEI